MKAPWTKEVAAIARLLGLPLEHVALVGSKLICGEGNDFDLLVLGGPGSVEKLEAEGFVRDFEQDLEQARYEGAFVSYRKGTANVLLVLDRGYFLSEIAIAHAARFMKAFPELDMNLRDTRVAFHGAVRHGVSYYLEAGRD